jgi:hypothetical protein
MESFKVISKAITEDTEKCSHGRIRKENEVFWIKYNEWYFPHVLSCKDLYVRCDCYLYLLAGALRLREEK